MNHKLKIAKVNSSDIESIRKLFRHVFKKDITSEYLWWLYKNPAGGPIGNIAKSGNKLVGLYLLVPIKMKVGKNQAKTAISVTTMVHQKYRKQGIFSKLYEETVKEAKNLKIRFIYGFPNEISYPLFLKKSWREIKNISLLEKNLVTSSKDYQENINDLSCKTVDRFDKKLDRLWAESRRFYGNLRIRDKDSLNWRFKNVRLYHKYPQRDYRKIICQEGNKLGGYVVIKFYKKGQEKKAHIVDIFSKEKNLRIMVNMVLHSIDYCQRQGYKKLSCWEPNEEKLLDKMLKLRFRKSKIFQPFLVNYLNNKTVKSPWPSWHITMADSDNF